eukprot:Seg1476.4 transcript_id=Seg1476.4/GoldUCD/mRNA.D3Y31 product="Universal stress protein A-like protein" protein_id=Seg1476.4/GoldUCD/D3Y31
MASGKGRTIILPVDGSEHSERAFDWYLKNLKQDGDNLHILNVVEPPKIPASFFSPVVVSEEYKDDIEDVVKKSKETAGKFEAKCKQAGVSCTVSNEAADFGPGEKICEVAKKHNASGIVMGSRGLNIIRKTLLGSVSSYVVNHSEVPVVVAPPSTK